MIAITGGVLCAGNIVEDLLVRPADKLVFDTTVWVDEIRTSLGGNGANTSYTLARLGVPVRLASVAGRDDAGDRCLAALSLAGVDTQSVQRSELPTPMTVVLVRSDGARAFFHRPGCAAEAFPIDLLPGPSHFHFGNVFALPSYRALLGDVMARAQEAGLTTSLDTGWDSRGEWAPVIDPALAHTDILFVNHDEAERLSGESDLSAAARHFLTRGVRLVVAKRGRKGCSVHAEGLELRVPGFRVEAVDSTGAGDCFAGAFLAALAHEMSAEDAARFANAVGALNVREVGAVGGVRSFDETIAWMRSESRG